MGNNCRNFKVNSKQPYSTKESTTKPSYVTLHNENDSSNTERTGVGNHLNTTDTGSSSGWPTCAASSSRPTGTDSLDSLTALDEVAVKICGLITENEAFRQIITDAVSIAFQKNLNSLEKKINSLKDENQFLRQQVEAQEQYSRRNCLLIHGLPPSQSPTNNDDIIKTFIKDKLNITILDCDIDRCHRLGGAGEPIIIKFARHNIKSLVYKNKKKLKGSEYLITESLTKTRKYCLEQLKELRKSGVISSYWTLDGEIYYIDSNNNNKKIHLKSLSVEDIEVVEIKT